MSNNSFLMVENIIWIVTRTTLIRKTLLYNVDSLQKQRFGNNCTAHIQTHLTFKPHRIIKYRLKTLVFDSVKSPSLSYSDTRQTIRCYPNVRSQRTPRSTGVNENIANDKKNDLFQDFSTQMGLIMPHWSRICIIIMKRKLTLGKI